MGIETMRVSESATVLLATDCRVVTESEATLGAASLVGQPHNRPCRACVKIHHHQTQRFAFAPYEVSEQHRQLAGWINAHENDTGAEPLVKTGKSCRRPVSGQNRNNCVLCLALSLANKRVVHQRAVAESAGVFSRTRCSSPPSQRDAVDSLRNIRQPIVPDGRSVWLTRRGPGCSRACGCASGSTSCRFRASSMATWVLPRSNA